jgi:NAD(P)-dependent dehydrogenase (short-subunit alcohol dehydrogenase family)
MSNDGKVVLVTGAGSGIGRAVALAFAKAGYRLAVTGRRPEPLNEVVAEAGKPAVAIPADMTDPKSVAALFNNAGTNAPAINLEELTAEQWKSVVDTNISGVFYCTQEAFRIMKDQNPQGGRIINNGSISATAPRPNSAPYTASKHAVHGLTKSTALDGRKYNIACGQIDIGNTLTPMAAQMQKGVLQADLSIKTEPTFDVKHVAESVLYMASLPLDANVLSLTVMATKMPFVGRG